MGKETPIEWCDSVCNTQMGCDGCELWNEKTLMRHCYAGVLTERYAGRAGYPLRFSEPTLFLDRMNEAIRWPDLAGTKRPDKPWLDGLPRMIFYCDMGDAFTESLPLDWMAQPWGPTVCPKGHKRPQVQWLADPGVWCCSAKGCCVSWKPMSLLECMARTPHIWMMLTKRGSRMREFSEKHPLPANVWPGVSVTSKNTLARLSHLLGVRGGGVRWISVEPLLEDLGDISAWLNTQQFNDALSDVFSNVIGAPVGKVAAPSPQGLVIVGGESGPGSRPCNLEWIRSIVAQCKETKVPVFVKQLGAAPVRDGALRQNDHHEGAGTHRELVQLRLIDRKGGAMREWPEDLRVREFPNPKGNP